jgi:hypothetical protein
MSDIRYLKTSFVKLELLACAVAVPDVVSIMKFELYISLTNKCFFILCSRLYN